jgi:hypothetical protein
MRKDKRLLRRIGNPILNMWPWKFKIVW